MRRRIVGEPLQYLLGEWEFYGYPFKVGKGVLIPRPETELLVDAAKQHNPRLVLDLCAGTGCVGVSLAKELGCNVIAVEKSPEACEYLKANIKLNKTEQKVTVINDDVLNMSESFAADCILINPPYLSKEEMLALQKEVAYEPTLALYGGDDGLGFYRAFFKAWGTRLNRDNLFFATEVGDKQANEVCRLMKDIGLSPETIEDFNGIKRVVCNAKGNNNVARRNPLNV